MYQKKNIIGEGSYFTKSKQYYLSVIFAEQIHYNIKVQGDNCTIQGYFFKTYDLYFGNEKRYLTNNYCKKMKPQG